MDVFEDKNKRYRKQLTKLGGNRVLRSRPRAAVFVVSFANLKSRAKCALESRLLTKILLLSPDFVAARSLRSLRSNNL